MALDIENVSALAYSNGFTLWHYTTTDTAVTVDSAGYFNAYSGDMRVGDFIMANCDTDGTPASGIFLVNANSGGVVDVSNITAIGGSDTD